MRAQSRLVVVRMEKKSNLRNTIGINWEAGLNVKGKRWNQIWEKRGPMLKTGQ